jgi:CRISPR-associated protein Cmr4
MFQLAKPLFLTCETPLHAGSGDSLGVVDLPIQRERHTSFPKIEASSLKGALREAFEELNRDKTTDTEADKKVKSENRKSIIAAFGPNDGDLYAGALGFTDARLLLFPIKSMKGVFAWVTCPKALRQFAEDLKLTEDGPLVEDLPSNPADGKAILLQNTSSLVVNPSFLVLEEYTFVVEASNKKGIVKKNKEDQQPVNLAKWLADNLFAANSYWHEKAEKDIVVLSDNDFKDFVNLSTEVITRIKIDNTTGTVQKGALFTEEYLPAESVMYALVLASPEFLTQEEAKKKQKARPDTANESMNFFSKTIAKQQVVQLGGNATLGKGLLRAKIPSSN